MAYINKNSFWQYPLAKKIFILAFILRFIACCLTYYGITLPGGGNTDISRFMIKGIDFLDSGIEDDALDISQSYFYSLIIAYIYKITGSSVFLPLLLNVLLGSFAVVFYYKASCLLLNIKNAKPIGIFLALTPTYIFFSSMLLREVFIHFFLSLHIYLLALWFNSNKLSHYINALFAIIAACIFHVGIIFFLLGIVFLGTIKLLNNKKHILSRIVLGIIFVFSLFWLLTYFQIGKSKMPWLYYENANISKNIDAILRKQKLKFIDKYHYSLYADLPTPSDNQELIVFYFPRMVIRTIYNYVYHPRLAPNLTNIIKITEALFFSLFVIASLFPAYKSKKINYLIIISWLTVIVYSLGSGEHGQANRHFFKFAAVFLLTGYPSLKALLQYFLPTRKATILFNQKYIYRSLNHKNIT